MRSFLAVSALMGAASAHFQLLYPEVRGYSEDTLGTFPCGGQNGVSPNRTAWPLAGGPVQLNMEHAQTNVQVLLAIGSDPGSAFNTVLVKTFTIDGIGHFCIADVPLPNGLNITAGSNATIQVVSNNENGGGLYNCADITFTNDTKPAGETCNNGTGVSAVSYSNPNANANTTSTSSSGSGSGSSSTKSAASNVGIGSLTALLGASLALIAASVL